MVSNPYLELNDKVVVYDKYTYTDDLFILSEIKEDWREPALKDTLVFKDSGLVLDPFIWDRNGIEPGINDIGYDRGFVWDQALPINATADDQNYDFLKAILFN